MAMGTRRKRERQQDLWIATSDVVETPGNAFYDRLNQILAEHKFDAKVERVCQKFYKKSPYGRPSISPGVYFRSLLIGYFEGLDSERGIAWRTADSLAPACGTLRCQVRVSARRNRQPPDMDLGSCSRRVQTGE